ncbi:MAG: signal recognition particle protein [Bacillota bacterium]|nr:signal recognition particle protein [Bacillota bacterium]
MAFENLTARLAETFRRLRGKGRLTEADVDAALREVRVALLEADVNFRVAKEFIARVRERAVGRDILESLTPAQQVIKVVYEELAALLGGAQAKLGQAGRGPTVIMLCGLQGSGKTTTAGKLALHLKKQGRRPLLVACDVYRPAAVQQLQVVGEAAGVPVFSRGTVEPVGIAWAAVEHARQHGHDLVLLDTAGRLHIDAELMEELRRMKEAVHPHEILLVVDAMTGQDAVAVAERFNADLGVDGVILTKFDGDARGGAALSLRAVTGKPIKFVGTGEKLEGLEPFHPDRAASRILGMGDVLTLIEKAEEAFDAKQAQKMQEKLQEARFDLEDFLAQMQQMRKMGPLNEVLRMLPGAAGRGLAGLQVDERQLKRVEAIIQSMTSDERRNPQIIDGSRRRRIAAGSGTQIQDVNRLLKQFEATRQLLRQFGFGEKKTRHGRRLPFFR